MKLIDIILAVLLAIVISSGGVLYLKYMNMRKAHELNQDKVLELSGEIDQLKREHIPQLEDHIAKLKEEIQNKENAMADLQKELKEAGSRIPSLKDEIVRGESELREQRARISEIEAAYDAMISDLKDQIEKKQVSISRLEERLSITFVDRILFEFGKATLTDQGRETLEKVGRGLKNIRGRKIRVMGHADDIPIHPDYQDKFPSNWELSAARAAAVVRYFQNENGLDPKGMEAVGRSFYYPVASNETAEGRAQNRRVEVAVGPALD
jgi:chemotaxis protein MotB